MSKEGKSANLLHHQKGQKAKGFDGGNTDFTFQKAKAATWAGNVDAEGKTGLEKLMV